MGNIITRDQFIALNDKNFSKIFVDEIGNKESIFDKWINVVTIEDAYTKMSGVTGLPLLTQSKEGGEFTLDQIFSKFNQTFTPLTYKQRVRITREAWMDDHTGTLKVIPKLQSIAAKDTVEQDVANLVDRCQNGSYLGPDGKVLSATDHPLKGGVSGTFSNRATTNAVLTLSSLEAGIIGYKTIPNDQGIRRPRNPKYIKVANENEINLGKIMDSKYTLTNNLIENQIQKFGLTPIIDSYSTNSALWCLIGPKEEHQIFLVWREQPNTKMDADVATDDILQKCFLREVTGWVDARGFWGSTGS